MDNLSVSRFIGHHMKKFLVGLIFLIPALSFSEDVPKFLKDLQGCFDVHFRYAETAHPSYEERLTEWVVTEKRDDGVIVVTHYAKEIPSFVPFHYKEEWRKLENGSWKQTIVSSSSKQKPCDCNGVIEGSKMKCDANNDPMPRRDRKKSREDFSYIKRQATAEILKNGWVNIEINEKVKADGTFLAKEIGLIEYTRTPEEDECKSFDRGKKKLE